MSKYCYIPRSPEELIFWLNIMHDHTIFIYNALPCSEAETARQAKKYSHIFDELLQKTRGMAHITPNFASTIARQVSLLRCFKVTVLNKLINCEVSINLPPTLISHMIMEANEFMLVLSPKCEFSSAAEFAIHEHNLWLPDASGHAAIVRSTLDATEKELIYAASQYQELFDDLSIRARAFTNMLSTDGNLEYVPALHRLNRVSYQDINRFRNFLLHLNDLLTKCEILSFADPLLPDHMARESAYYMDKIINADKTSC